MSPNLYFSEPEYLLFRLSDRRLIVPLTDDMREHGEFRDVWSRIPAGAVNVCVEYANLRVAFESNSLLSDRPRVLSNRRGVWAQFVDFGPERATHRNGREVISEFHLQDRLENVIRAGYVVGQLGQLHFVDRNGISDVLDLQVLPDEPPAKVPRTTGDIVLALCALQETQLSRDNVGPLPDKSHETHHRVYERLFEYGDKLVFCEAICAVYDGMRLGSTLMEFIELLYGEAYRFAGAALRTTISPYGFYLKKGFRPHVFSMGYTYYPPLLENGQCEYQCEHLLVSRADSEDHSYLMMKRFF